MGVCVYLFISFSLCIYPLINGCILHLLAIVNSAAVNMGVQIFEAMLSLLQGIYSEVGLLDIW